MNKNPRKMVLYGVLGLVLLFLGIHGAARMMLSVDLPAYEPVAVTWLDEGRPSMTRGQNWTVDDWQWFYHASQGSSFELILPTSWLMALEQPRLPFSILGKVPRLVEPDYMARFGFLPDPVTRYDPQGLSYTDWMAGKAYSTYEADSENNPDGLPVGFARTPNYVHPLTGETLDVVGFNCSTCHTGQINYQGTGLRIEGGPAMINLGAFKIAIGYALAYTYYLPTRFSRFADAVLGENHTRAERDTLKADLKALIGEGQALKKMIAERGIYPTTEGFARLDALGRIGNFVFGVEITEDNFDVSNAPVNFPHIWDTPWFEWVQYNASIKQPIVRNAGEAMGVFARVDFQSLDDTTRLFRSTINVQNLYEMESLIRGEKPFTGLASPKWPESVLGAIDSTKAAEGARLYRKRCQSCHLPPMEDAAFYHDAYWTEPDEHGNQYLKLPIIELDRLGTDPLQTVNFGARMVKFGELGRMDFGALGETFNVDTVLAAADALPFLVAQAVEKRYRDLGIPDSLWDEYNGLRDNDLQAPLAYKARPLDGIWATPPYLHNGAVPNLYQLLAPVEERAATFYLGTREFDPVHVGYQFGEMPGGFELDTSLPGNSNAGHEFRGSDDKKSDDYWRNLGQGVIGPALDEAERMALVEYLKTL